MIRFAVILTMLLAGGAGPAVAQNTGGVGQAIGDILSDVLGNETRQVRAHVVLATAKGLVVRTSDGRTHPVDTRALVTSEWRSFEAGQAVTLAVRRDTRASTLIATSIQADPSGTRAAYEVLRGTVESISRSEATVRTGDGRFVSFDISSVPDAARPTRGDAVAVAYDAQNASGRRTALWIQDDATASTTQPAASPTTTSGYQRIHGYVQSIGVSTLTLKRDSGQTVTVDTSGLDAQAVASTRPGDVVSVVGRMTEGEFRAELLRKE